MKRTTIRAGGITLTLLFLALSTSALPDAAYEALSPCARSAKHARQACEDEARCHFWRTVAQCDHLPTAQERIDCRTEARRVARGMLAECERRQKRRHEICDELPDLYHPLIDPEDFVDTVDNPYFPLEPGLVMVYEVTSDEGAQAVEIRVLHERRDILGVSCTSVRSTVTTDDGEPVENTIEWFAQDRQGNVWLFGEISRDYDAFEVTDVDTWIAGEREALPGIVMKAEPMQAGMYRQQLAIGESEDVSQLLRNGETVEVPFGVFEDCIVTLDESPLEENDSEEKVYAPFAGLILETNVDTGERMALVDIRIEDDDE